MNTTENSWEHLLQAAKCGDEEAAEELFREVQGELAKHIKAGVGSDTGPIQGSDILQTVLYQAWMQLARCEASTRTSFLAWLKRIADNRLIDSIRLWKAAKRGGNAQATPPRKQGEQWLVLIDEITSGQVGPATGALNRELEDVVRRSVDELPDNYRQPIVAFYFEGRQAQEIAERMNTAEGTIFVRLSRAREMLRDNIYRALGTSIIR